MFEHLVDVLVNKNAPSHWLNSVAWPVCPVPNVRDILDWRSVLKCHIHFQSPLAPPSHSNNTWDRYSVYVSVYNIPVNAGCPENWMLWTWACGRAGDIGLCTTPVRGGDSTGITWGGTGWYCSILVFLTSIAEGRLDGDETRSCTGQPPSERWQHNNINRWIHCTLLFLPGSSLRHETVERFIHCLITL